jgi:hypothetical protein
MCCVCVTQQDPLRDQGPMPRELLDLFQLSFR